MSKYYSVRLTITTWPEIYGGFQTYSFLTEHTARQFAKGNLREEIPCARVYAPSGELVHVEGDPSQDLQCI